MSERIRLNSARCLKCGTVLVSRHRHDLAFCPCGNFVDGGLDYLRRGGNPDDLEELSEHEKPPAPPTTTRKEQDDAS